MGIVSAITVLPLGLMVLCSGLFVNLLQICSLPLLAFSRKLFRLVNMTLFELISAQVVCLFDWWAGVELRIYADKETRQHFGKEHALVICNHRSDIDWLVGWAFASRCGCLDGARAVMKKMFKMFPVIGWGMWLTEYIFLERNWKKDEMKLKSGFQSWRDFPRVLWVALFVEGTRFTPDKLKAAQEFARLEGLPVPRNVLVPKTKGFVCAVENLRSFVPAVYDVTFAISKDSSPPTMKRILNRQSSTVHMLVTRVSMEQLPMEREEIAKWCREAFVKKDDLLDQHKVQNTFGEELYEPVPRPVKPLLIVIAWSSLFLVVAAKLLAPLLKTTKGIVGLVAVLLLVSAIIEAGLMATQSERSTPAKPIPANRVPAPDSKLE